MGCSSFSWQEFFGEGDSSQKRNEELMKDFEVDKKFKNKFQVQKDKKTVAKKVEAIKKVVEKPVKQAPVINKKPVVKPVTKVKPKPEIKTVKAEPAKPIYPKDFPEELKAYDETSKSYWKDFKPVVFPGEKVVLNITYMGINTGKITIRSKNNSVVGDDPVYHLNARIKTSDYYSYLYEVDDFCDSYVRMEDFRPLKFSLIQRESSQNIDDLQLFDLEQLSAISLYKRVTDKKTKKKKRVKPIPRFFQDPLSIVYFLRGLPLEKKASYDIPVVNQGRSEIMTIETGEVEEIETKIGEKKAYVLHITTRTKGKTIKGGKMKFWYSADDRKIFLKFKAEIKIGSVSGNIESYKF